MVWSGPGLRGKGTRTKDQKDQKGGEGRVCTGERRRRSRGRRHFDCARFCLLLQVAASVSIVFSISKIFLHIPTEPQARHPTHLNQAARPTGRRPQNHPLSGPPSSLPSQTNVSVSELGTRWCGGAMSRAAAHSVWTPEPQRRDSLAPTAHAAGAATLATAGLAAAGLRATAFASASARSASARAMISSATMSPDRVAPSIESR